MLEIRKKNEICPVFLKEKQICQTFNYNRKKRGKKSNKIRNERGDIATDVTDTKDHERLQ